MLDTFSYFLSLKKKKNGQGEKWGGEKKKGLYSDDQNPSAVGWHLLPTCHFSH